MGRGAQAQPRQAQSRPSAPPLASVLRGSVILDPYTRHADIRHMHGRPVAPTWRSPLAKADAPAPAQSYQWLHDLADAAAPAVRRAFLDAIQKVRGTVKEAELRAALETGNVDAVMRALDLDQKVADALAAEMQTRLEDEFIQAGRAAVEQSLPKEIAASIRFDPTNPQSVAFLRQYDFGLIRQVTQETRDAVRTVVQSAFEAGGHPREQAKAIREFIGLTDRQAQAVLNYRAALVEEERPADQVERMVARYQQRLLKLRATTISRTETIRAANAGQQAAWRQAADQQLLNRVTTRRQWLVVIDDRLCPFCAAIPLLNPGGVSLDQSFASPLGPVDYPPLHPNCRCAMSLAVF